MHTPSAKISGVLLARLESEESEESEAAAAGGGGDGKAGGFIRESDLAYAEDDEPTELVVAPLGASVEGGVVTAFEPLGFLP